MTREEFDAYLTRDYAHLQALAVQAARGAEGAEDLLHTALVKLCQTRAWEKCDGPDRLRGYLYTAMRNTAHTEHTRSLRRAETLVDGTAWWDSTLSVSCDKDPLGRVEARAALAPGMTALPDRWREVVVQRILLDRTERQTAECLGIPVTSVGQAHRRALGRLREVITV